MLPHDNFFLGWWEDTHVFIEDMEEFTSKIILSLFSRGVQAFKNFVERLNNDGIGLRFTFELNKFTFPFLDVLISKVEDGQLNTKIYCKETATNSLLRWESCHPKSLLKGIPKGQYLRERRNCSSEEIFVEQSRNL